MFIACMEVNFKEKSKNLKLVGLVILLCVSSMGFWGGYLPNPESMVYFWVKGALIISSFACFIYAWSKDYNSSN
jgi:EamA domain-containing membrane protein RarD